jgi:ABC-type nitrate/sulfonate/bicarbonate transport systems, periplasmic components
MTRRAFSAGVLATGVALTVGCTRRSAPDPVVDPEGELRLVRVNTGLGLATGREAYLTVAEEKGFFAEEGIRIEVIPGEGTVTNLTQLATGQVDVATIDINAGLVEFAKGAFTDFVLTAVLHAQLLGCIIVREDSGSHPTTGPGRQAAGRHPRRHQHDPVPGVRPAQRVRRGDGGAGVAATTQLRGAAGRR